MSHGSLEIELKAALSPDDLDAVRHHALLKEHTEGRAVSRLVRTQYYDTAERSLERAGISLRIRRDGKLWVQTIKQDRDIACALHRVRETDTRLPSPEPDLTQIDDPRLRSDLEALVGGQALERVFVTDVRRTSRRLRNGDGLIDLAIDTGEIRAGDRTLPVHEVEFELKSGTAGDVYNWASRLLSDRAARISLPSKAARGYSLDQDRDALPDARPRSAIAAHGVGQTAGEAFSVQIGIVAQALADALHLTLTEEDPEGPHQTRVALRRLRVLLEAYRPILPNALAKSLSRAAKKLGRTVAPLRDSDVLLLETVGPTLDPASPEDTALRDALQVWRAEIRARTRSALREAEATGLAIRLLHLAETGAWQPKGKAKRKRSRAPATTVTAPALEAIWSTVRQYGKRLDTLSETARHDLRKDLKRLRYTLEASGHDLSKATFKVWLRQVKSLQSALGLLNDFATLAEIHPDLPAGDSGRFEAVRRARLEDLSADLHQKEKAANRAMKTLRAETPPWRRRKTSD